MNATALPTVTAPATCRVCGQPTQPFFTKRLLGKHEVRFERCGACGLIQTEPPYWLAEAYANLSFRSDVGMVNRCIWTAQTTVALAESLGIGPAEPCLDWGGGTGMFVRLCRDSGMNFFYRDPYAQNIFAGGFEAPPNPSPGQYQLITAFEVVEHFPNPAADFATILALQPEFFLFSTQLYRDQGPGWWYFSEDGQHVAIYARQTLALLAERHGYALASDDADIHLFARRPVSDRALMKARRKRAKWSECYQRRHGSRLVPDFEFLKSQAKTSQVPS